MGSLSDEKLLSALDKHDQLIRDCVAGRILFRIFLEHYNNFYMFYALDGHESGPEEQALFASHENRIAPHREVWDSIILRLCSDEDAPKESYIQAGYFGSDEATKRLKAISERYLDS